MIILSNTAPSAHLLLREYQRLTAYLIYDFPQPDG